MSSSASDVAHTLLVIVPRSAVHALRQLAYVSMLLLQVLVFCVKQARKLQSQDGSWKRRQCLGLVQHVIR